MSERDEQAKVLYESMVPGYLWERVEPEAHRQFWLAQADVLIAAGFRRIPDDCVVVDQGEFIRRMNYAIACQWDFGTDAPVEHFQEAVSEILLDDEIDWDAALSATRHGDNDV